MTVATDPYEIWKRAFLIGLGATAVTMDKVQELANDLIERGELTQKDAVSFSEDLRKRALKEKEQFESRIKDTVDDYVKVTVKNLGLVTREEFDQLKAELKEAKAAAKKNATKAKSK